MEQPTGSPNKITGDKRARIVLIEDNPSDVALLRLALDEEEHEYVLEVFTDGAEALSFVHAQRMGSDVEPEPCVIVLDLHLPKQDGAEVLRAIKDEPVLAHVHVVVLTTVASPSDEREVRLLGVSLYRQKPTKLNDFVQVAREILAICGQHVAARGAAVLSPI